VVIFLFSVFGKYTVSKKRQWRCTL